MQVFVIDPGEWTILLVFIGVLALILSKQITATKGEIMIKLDALNSLVDQLSTIVAGIQADYLSLQATIGSLRGMLIDDGAQVEIDAVVARLGASIAKLKVIDDSVVPDAPAPAPVLPPFPIPDPVNPPADPAPVEPVAPPAEPTPVEPPPPTEG